MIIDVSERMERLVSIQRTIDARLHEIDWYLSLENSNLSNVERYQQRLKEVRESLVEGLFSDLSQVNTKIKAVYFLYLDILKISSLS